MGCSVVEVAVPASPAARALLRARRSFGSFGSLEPVEDFCSPESERPLATGAGGGASIDALKAPETPATNADVVPSGYGLDPLFDFDEFDKAPSRFGNDPLFDFDELDSLPDVPLPGCVASIQVSPASAFKGDARPPLDACGGNTLRCMAPTELSQRRPTTQRCRAASAAPQRAMPPPRPRASSAHIRRPPQGMRVAILVNGSRGDVQPAVALARELAGLRHQVRVMTNADNVEFCKRRGVEAEPVFASCSAVIESMGGVGGSNDDDAEEDNLRRAHIAAEAWLNANPSGCRNLDEALQDFGPQTVVRMTQALGPALKLEWEKGVPSIAAFLSLVQLKWDGNFSRRWPPRPSILGSSPYIEKLDAGAVSKDLTQSGPWLADDPPAAADFATGGPLVALQAFLASGSKPVAIGWGSMIGRGMSPEAMLVIAIRALKEAGHRGVILGGWARLEQLGVMLVSQRVLPGSGLSAAAVEELAAFAAERVCFVAEAPHGWLLPQCRCFVHHGGAGTTYAALAAGVPAIVTPFFWDQFDNAKAVEDLGTGVAFDAFVPEMAPEEIGRAIHAADGCAEKAAAVAAKLRAESNGAARAASIIDRFLHREVQSGRWGIQHRWLRSTWEAEAAAKAAAKGATSTKRSEAARRGAQAIVQAPSAAVPAARRGGQSARPGSLPDRCPRRCA